jgi:hypothetical protein
MRQVPHILPGTLTLTQKNMYPTTRKSSLVLVTALTSLVFAGTASAQWRITRPGSYKLFFNHNVGTGDGIIITASNVTLDLNGFTVTTNARGF